MARGRRRTGARLTLGTSVLALGAVVVAPACEPAPVSATVTCSLVSYNGEPPSPQQKLRATGLAHNRDYQFWIYADLDDGPFSITLGWSSTNEGALEIPTFSDEPPVYFAWTIFDDLNANGTWDRDVDRTYLHADATITDCPQTITMSPK